MQEGDEDEADAGFTDAQASGRECAGGCLGHGRAWADAFTSVGGRWEGGE